MRYKKIKELNISQHLLNFSNKANKKEKKNGNNSTIPKSDPMSNELNNLLFFLKQFFIKTFHKTISLFDAK